MTHNSIFRFAGLMLVSFSLVVACRLEAEVKLPGLYSDNMVLQQGKVLPVWGWADEGEVVTVTFRKHQVTAKAKDGRWMVRLPRQKAGGPDSLVVSGQNTVELKNVLVGEVWVCSGQSNMEWSLRASFESAADIAQSANPMIRLFTVPKLKANTPVNDVKASWRLCASNTVGDFSAVAYYFGRALQRDRKVPIGLIHTSWGGSPAEVWMREGVLAGNPEYKKDILETYTLQEQRYRESLEAYRQKKSEAEKAGQSFAQRPPGAPWKPCELYNGMIAPLIPYAICGAIWYQGESNAGRSEQYRTLFPDMIRNWRDDWHQRDRCCPCGCYTRPDQFPFLFVQLAPWDRNLKRTLEQITETPVDSGWAELREAQLLTALNLPNTGLAVITDVGDKDDIHPTKKAPVGERLALAARRIAYGERITHSGPIFDRLRVKGREAVLSFKSVGSGLKAVGGELQGFAVCGPDKKFVWAKAEIKGKKVIVSHPAMEKPVAVRYGWADYPVVNLFNAEGLPASPFRTDDFPMVTAQKKP